MSDCVQAETDSVYYCDYQIGDDHYQVASHDHDQLIRFDCPRREIAVDVDEIAQAGVHLAGGAASLCVRNFGRAGNDYWACILQLWRLPSHISHFPGANPMSIEKSDFPRLSEEDYLVALKTDGVRHLLLLTTKPNSAEPIAIMIDRTKRMYEIEIWANEDFFEHGSLYDGELVWEQNVLVYVVFDAFTQRAFDARTSPTANGSRYSTTRFCA